MKNKKCKTTKEVYFIATKYKNRKVNIDFYTSSGENVPANKVIKAQDKNGPKFYYCD